MILRLSHVVPVLLLAIVTVCSLAPAQTFKIAVVDMDAVSQQYKELADRQKELEAWIQEKTAFVKALRDFEFLSAEEFQEVARIYQVKRDQWTDAQKKREADLRGICTDNEKRFADLEGKPARTPQEQNQFNTLRDTLSGRDKDLEAISRKFDDELKARKDEVQMKLAGNVRGVIEVVAKAKGYTLVLDKRAVFYSVAPVDDITSEVLKSLNTAAAPATGGGNASGGSKP